MQIRVALLRAPEIRDGASITRFGKKGTFGTDIYHIVFFHINIMFE